MFDYRIHPITWKNVIDYKLRLPHVWYIVYFILSSISLQFSLTLLFQSICSSVYKRYNIYRKNIHMQCHNGLNISFYFLTFLCQTNPYPPIKSVLNNEYAGNVPFQQLLQILNIHGHCICIAISFLCDTCHMALKHFWHIHNRWQYQIVHLCHIYRSLATFVAEKVVIPRVLL